MPNGPETTGKNAGLMTADEMTESLAKPPVTEEEKQRREEQIRKGCLMDRAAPLRVPPPMIRTKR